MTRAGRWQELAWRLLPGSLMALVLGGIGQLGMLNPAEHLAYNYLFQLRGTTAWDDRVVVIAIDDASIQRLGRYPWPRRYFTQLMQRLNQAPPSVVTFDVIFSEPSKDDVGFRTAIAEHGRVVLAQAMDMYGLPLLPVQPLKEAAIGIGHIAQWVDSDGITRSLALDYHGEKGLSFQAVQAHGLSDSVPNLKQLPPKLWLNWAGPVQQIRQYAFVDVLTNQVPPTALQDKIIFVGITATGFDTLSTPFNRNPPVTGVYLHATAAHNLLRQNHLQPLNQNWLMWISLAIMPGFGLLLSYWRTEIQVIASGLCVVLLIGTAIGLLYYSYWLPIIAAISLVVGTTILVALTERLRMNHFLQAQVRHLWQTYPTTTAPTATHRRAPTLALPSSQPASIRTLTQLTAIAEQLGQAQATQIAITQSLSVGILAADPNGTVWFVNPTASQWLTIQSGQSLADCLSQGWLSPADGQSLMAPIFSPTATPEELPAAFQVEREVLYNDRWFWLKFERLSLTASDLYNQPANHLLLLMEDITSRKQIEENLAKQNQELQWLSHLKDDFISTISHELRSPITNMLMAIELIKVMPDPIQHQKYIQQLESECLRERDFINDLLSLQAPSLTVDKSIQQWIDLKTWLPELVFPFQARAATRQQRITTILDSHLPPIPTNQISLERILKELLTNACKYTAAGQAIQVKATSTATTTEIAVQNFGSEIPPEELSRIFEKFYRVPKADPWKQGGTGLGLAIVKRLTEQIGATIAVVSHGGYTEFTIQIPHPSGWGEDPRPNQSQAKSIN
jgi:CHASE2 domain-containing sensor protein/signal transduction histidine kinase